MAYNYAFCGIPTFLRTAYVPDLSDLQSKLAVFGVPFDYGSPFLSGSRLGPRSIREHSLRFPTTGYYSIELEKVFLEHELTDGTIVDVGDVDIVPSNIDLSFSNITKLVRQLLSKNVIPIALGGDHSITDPIVSAYEKPLHVLHFDAHMDYSEITEEHHRTNSHAFRYLSTRDHVKKITQVGIRSARSLKKDLDALKEDGNSVITMPKIKKVGIENVKSMLPKGEDCYITVDIDCLDMSLVPGCVSAEPDGLMYDELLSLLRHSIQSNNIVGIDLVEINPTLDVGTGVTSYLGACILVEMLAQVCEKLD